MTDKTKVQRAAEYIWKHPGCRSEALADLLDIKVKDVRAHLRTLFATGLVITCDVMIGDKRTVEYRPSATAPATCPDIRAWQAKHPKPPTAISDELKKHSVSVTQAGSGAITPAAGTSSRPSGNQDLPSTGPAVVEQPAARSHAAEATGAHPAAPAEPACSDVMFSLREDGKLVINSEWQTVVFSRMDTIRLGRFMVDTQTAWN